MKTVRRTLFHRNNVVPQKKVMTFNKNTDDFKFAVSYGDVAFLNDMQQRYILSRVHTFFRSGNLTMGANRIIIVVEFNTCNFKFNVQLSN